MVRRALVSCLVVVGFFTALFLGGCAAAPEVRPDHEPADRVLLRERPEVGDSYLTHFELRFEVLGRALRARRVFQSTVVTADADGALLDHHVESGGFDLDDPRIVLPPSADVLGGATLRERRDARGRRAGNLFVTDGSAAQRAELSNNPMHQVAGSPGLPEHAVELDETWTATGRWAYRVALPTVEGDPEVTYRLSSLSSSLVTLSVAGEVQTGDGNVLRVEGEIELDREDATLARGRLVGGLGDAVHYTITWRTERSSGATAGFDGSSQRDAAHSRILDPGACDTRIAELTHRMDVAPTGMPFMTDIEVPTASAGNDIPWGAPLGLVDQTFVIGGRVLDLDGAVELLTLVLRNERDAQPDSEDPIDVVLVANAGTPVSRLDQLSARLPEEDHTLSMLVRVEDPLPPPPPFAPGTPAAIEALAGRLDTAELASLAVGTCAPLVQSWGDAANVTPATVWLHHRVTVPRAMRACACRGTDVDLMDAVLMRVAIGERDPALRVVPIPRNLSALRLGRRATFGDLAAALSRDPR